MDALNQSTICSSSIRRVREKMSIIWDAERCAQSSSSRNPASHDAWGTILNCDAENAFNDGA